MGLFDGFNRRFNPMVLSGWFLHWDTCHCPGDDVCMVLGLDEGVCCGHCKELIFPWQAGLRIVGVHTYCESGVARWEHPVLGTIHQCDQGHVDVLIEEILGAIV